jgi:hypothetical protein
LSVITSLYLVPFFSNQDASIAGDFFIDDRTISAIPLNEYHAASISRPVVHDDVDLMQLTFHLDLDNLLSTSPFIHDLSEPGEDTYGDSTA